jgi:hypothetical protein
VTTGWFNDSFIEITSGLKEGDQVLLAPVSDEEIEETPEEDTNKVDTASPPPGSQTFDPSRRGEFNESSRPGQESPMEDRRFQRRNGDSPDTGAPTERRFERRGDGSSEGGPPSGGRRSREGFNRRPQNSPDAPQ